MRSDLFSSTKRTRIPRGTTLFELLVAATMVLVGITGLGQGVVHAHRLLKEARHQRAAIDELSNQLERLASLTGEARAQALGQVEPSNWIQQMLPDVRIHAKEDGEDGEVRLVGTIEWKRFGQPTTLSLVDWVDEDSPQVEKDGAP